MPSPLPASDDDDDSADRPADHSAAPPGSPSRRIPGASREEVIAAWVDALRRQANAASLRALPELTPDESARVMALMRQPDTGVAAHAGQAAASATPRVAPDGVREANTPPAPGEFRFQPRLTLQTLGRGEGLLGLRPGGRIGPRATPVTVAFIDWTYLGHDGLEAEVPAPTSVLNTRAATPLRATSATGGQAMAPRDVRAEADALDTVWDLGLLPLDAATLQWRDRPGLAPGAPVWTLEQEARFADLWADELPRLREAGWRIIVRPGFAHESVAVAAWRLVIDHQSGELLGREPVGPMGARAAGVTSLRQPVREGSFLVSLGVEIEGEVWDLAPLLWDLLRRDSRWLDAGQIARIDDRAIITLRAPGGRRVEAPAAPLKAIVGTMVDLLSEPSAPEGPLRLAAWEAHRLDSLRASLLDTQVARAGPHGSWQLQGDAGLRELARRLRDAAEHEQAVAADPAGLGITLRPYQQRGLAWLQYLRAHDLAGILADDMGLGKTAQALAHVLMERQAGRLAGAPALVVVPTSLVFNWQAEAARMAPGLRLLTLHGPDRAELAADLADHDLVLTTYPLVWRDIDRLAAQRFHLLILDEAQTVKNPTGRAAGALRRLQARHRLCLTGTPLENHLGELWAQFDFLMPGFLGDLRGFNRRWRKPIEENGETLRAELLRRRVRPFILRRRKDEVASELPPKTEIIEKVVLQGRQRALYESVRVAADELVRRVLQRHGFAGGLITILDALLKLRQVCDDPRLLKGRRLPVNIESAKRELLRDLLPALVAEGRRVLVFSQFTAMLSLVQADLEALGLPFLSLTGDTPPARRGAVVREFQAGGVPVLLLSLKAGGVGLNLTAADTVIHVDPWWNPAVERQATDRAHRIGQDRPVFVYKLIVAGSIEERILELQARKAALAEGVLGEDGGLGMKFSAADLDAFLAPLG